MSSNIVCLLGFDMETDIGSWTPFYEGLVHGTPKIVELLQEQSVRATFFFTGHAARSHPEIAAAVAGAGHEVGCHSLYHETVGDEIFPIPGVFPLLDTEVFTRVQTATDWVQEAVKSDVVSFRAPRLWGSTALVRALVRLGYVADATYPMYFYREQLAPYHPSAEDWTKQGDLSIVEIPNFADMTMDSADPYGRDRDQWPVFRTKGAGVLVERIDAYRAFAGARGVDPVVLCFYLHPWEFHPMPQGAIHYGEGSVLPDPMLVHNCGDRALNELKLLIDELRERGCSFMTARDIAKEFAA